MKFEEQLAKDAQDVRLQQFVPVGWFVSHARGEFALTESDVEIFSKYFKEPWQATLVVCPDRGVAMKAAFFLREPDGTLRPDKSYREFSFPDRLAGVIDTAPRGVRPDVRSAARPSQQPAAPARIERSSTQAASTDSTRYHPSPIPQRKMWPWFAGGGALLAIAILFGIRFWQAAQPQSLGLILTEREGQLQIEWNSTVRPIMRANTGSLNILDGSNVQRIALSRAQLAEGRYMYTRKSADVEVRMEVEGDGDTIRESSSFLGRPPVPTPSVDVEKAERPQNEPPRIQPTPADRSRNGPATSDPEKSALQDENKRLRQENAALKERIQQQERMQKILESRLGIHRQIARGLPAQFPESSCA